MVIYLDNSATTPIDPRVTEAMLPYLKEEFGNPSSKYYTLAENANRAVSESRQKIANLINCKRDEIIFTGCASESNNFIIKGISDYLHTEKRKGNHIITSKVEHKSVLEPCKFLQKRGFKVTYLDVNQYGQVEIETLKQAITDDTILVSLIWGNNEIGTLNNIKELRAICEEKHILFHSDATQVLGKIEVDTQDVPVDFLTFSAHKMYGPKGVGGCFIRKTTLGLKQKITPLIHGGEQEMGYRAGTLAVHNIVGLGRAAEIAKNEMKDYIPQIIENEKYLITQLKQLLPNITFNGHPVEKIPGVISVTIPDIHNEVLVRKLKNDVAISTGSACSISEPSYVLQLIISSKKVNNSFRISLNKFNSNEEIVNFLYTLKNLFN